MMIGYRVRRINAITAAAALIFPKVCSLVLVFKSKNWRQQAKITVKY
jgi:hypothetical protein